MRKVIEIRNLSKLYRLGEVGTGSLGNDLNRWWQTRIKGNEDPYTLIGQSNRRDEEATSNYVWALQNINLDVYEGDVIGIIGANGAGKSTLLKLISQITSPTTGHIKAKGRIGSLLEVGTGMHPDMTARENIFLNGAILGMNRHEIKQKFDEIIDFAGVVKYVDTPVKRFSSGMRVRLGFAVAAFLEPEILIVDEVLAVGDLEFQKKAIDKMTEISKSDRTILFVSHNMSSIKNLCDRGVLIQNGRVKNIDSVEKIISEYILEKSIGNDSYIDLKGIDRDQGVGSIIYSSLEFINQPYIPGSPIEFKIKLKTKKANAIFKELDLGVAINDVYNNRVYHVSNRFIYKEFVHDSDDHVYQFKIDNILKPGQYNITLFLRTKDEIQDWLRNIISFTVNEGNPYGYHDSKQIQGVVFPQYDINQL